ncbi:MAG: hypothetical protein NT103_07120 [Campylobacterales bacterium]|nr:hypothetical protein [Campylobacterales bacterium]
MDTVNQPLIEPAHSDKIRVITLVILIIIALIISVFTLLFTTWGNRQIAPILQKQIESVLGQPVTLTSFRLTLTHFELALSDKTDNRVRIAGSYTALPPYINAHYDANLSVPEGMNIAKFPMELSGMLKGSYYNLDLNGTAHLFSGDMTYNSTLLMMKPNTLTLALHDIHYQELMDALEYPHESDTLISGNVNVSGIVRRDINATGKVIATTHRFKSSTIREEDNESFDFWSLLADKNGKIQPFKINANIKAHVDELGILEQFAYYPLRTSASGVATLQGSQHQLTVNAHAKAVKGEIDTQLTLHKLHPSKLRLEIKHADIPSLFTLLSLPAPISGTLNGSINSNFSNATVSLEIQKARTQSAILKQDYGITQPDITFDSKVKVILSPKERHYSGTFTSDLQSLKIDGSAQHDQMLQELLRQINQNRPKGEF